MNNSFIYKLKESYVKKQAVIKARLSEFQYFREYGRDEELFLEMTFCILAAGTSARMAMRSTDAVRDVLVFGDYNQIKNSLTGFYRYPNLRAYHLIQCREFIKNEYGFKITEMLDEFTDPIERRGFLAKTEGIRGIGFKEASHFLRNIGYCGYGILDKHIIGYLYQLGLVESYDVPATENKYLETERTLIRFSQDIGINIDELDLLLWSEKTGEILK